MNHFGCCCSMLSSHSQADFNEQIQKVEDGTPLCQLPVLDIPVGPTFSETEEYTVSAPILQSGDGNFQNLLLV